MNVYDGARLPLRDGSCDAVFSSNVLEHVGPLTALLAETRRVLVSGGLCVHILPSVPWRLWTSLAAYVYVLAYAAGRRRPPPGAPPTAGAAALARRHGLRHAISRPLLLPFRPHGTAPSAVHELNALRRARWRRRFEAHGFLVREVIGGELFYTGYGLLPWLSLPARHRLACVLGGATNVFVLESSTAEKRDPAWRELGAR